MYIFGDRPASARRRCAQVEQTQDATVAIAHLRATVVGAGTSAVAAAAYRHRATMFDASEDCVVSYAHKKDAPAHEEQRFGGGDPMPTLAAVRAFGDAVHFAHHAQPLGPARVIPDLAPDIIIAAQRADALVAEYRVRARELAVVAYGSAKPIAERRSITAACRPSMPTLTPDPKTHLQLETRPDRISLGRAAHGAGRSVFAAPFQQTVICRC
jgi:hypothetical protein